MNIVDTSPVSSSVMLTMYPVIIPFCPSIGGVSHVSRIEREETATAAELRGGELGTVYMSSNRTQVLL